MNVNKVERKVKDVGIVCCAVAYLAPVDDDVASACQRWADDIRIWTTKCQQRALFNITRSSQRRATFNVSGATHRTTLSIAITAYVYTVVLVGFWDSNDLNRVVQMKKPFELSGSLSSLRNYLSRGVLPTDIQDYIARLNYRTFGAQWQNFVPMLFFCIQIFTNKQEILLFVHITNYFYCVIVPPCKFNTVQMVGKIIFYVFCCFRRVSDCRSPLTKVY